jgi:hypothetical protein
MIFVTDIPQQDLNIFDCISIKNEIFMPAKESDIIDYFVTVYPRNENRNDFPFVYGLFESKDIAFANNQDVILNIASLMFADSLPLSEFEQAILNYTFKKSIKVSPTLPGRK